MIVCTRCGFQNENSDTFCGSCAGFLEWSGQKVVEEAPPEPEPERVPEPEPEHAGFIDRVKDAIGIGEAKEGDQVATGATTATSVAAPAPVPAAAGAGLAPAAAAAVAPSIGAGSGPVTTSPPAPVGMTATTAPPLAAMAAAPPLTAPPAAPPVSQPDPVPPSAPTAVARTAVAPAAVAPGAVAPAAVQPEAVKPVAAKARPAPKSKVAPSRVVNPGDLVCGQCGEGNDPARKFCRRCGASLQQAVVFTLPWYRRMWRKLTTRRTRQAGERPRARRRAIGGAGPGWLTSWVTRIIVLAIIVVVILSFVGPWSHSLKHRFSNGYHDVKNVVNTSYTPIHPLSASATSSAPAHGAALAIDGASNTSWQTGSRGDGVGQSLSIKLATATNVDKIGFLIGDTDTPQAYVTEPRPELIRVTFVGPHAYTKDITLKDIATFQTFTVKAKASTSLIITLDSVYPSAQGTHAAITEVELFKKN